MLEYYVGLLNSGKKVGQTNNVIVKFQIHEFANLNAREEKALLSLSIILLEGCDLRIFFFELVEFVISVFILRGFLKWVS